MTDFNSSSYNKTGFHSGNGTLMGNWVEERTLLEKTGQARELEMRNPSATHNRVIGQWGDGNTWETESREKFKRPQGDVHKKWAKTTTDSDQKAPEKAADQSDANEYRRMEDA
eukprot:149453_1